MRRDTVSVSFSHSVWYAHCVPLSDTRIVLHYALLSLCCTIATWNSHANLHWRIWASSSKWANQNTCHISRRFFSSFLLFIWRSTANYWSNIVQGSKQVFVLYLCDRYPHSTSGIIINNNSSGIKNIQYSMRQSPFIMISWFICSLFSCRALCIQLSHTHTHNFSHTLIAPLVSVCAFSLAELMVPMCAVFYRYRLYGWAAKMAKNNR